jgi:hypothetical protein
VGDLRKVSLTEAEPGMVLAQPVVNEKGMNLAGPGAEVNERLLMRFENMGIAYLWVETDDSVDKQQATKLKETIEKRFAVAGPSEIWSDLKAILQQRVDQRVK